MTRAIRLVVFSLSVMNAYAETAVGRVGGKMHLEDISLGVIANDDVIPNPANTFDQVIGRKTWPPGDSDDRPTEEIAFQIKFLNGQSPTLTPAGNSVIDGFFDFEYSIHLRRGTDPFVQHTGTGTAHILGESKGGGERPKVHWDVVLTEVLGMMGNFDPTSPFLIRESPTHTSRGVITVEPIPGGQYLIDGFLDIATEMSVDGGLTWAEATPEPSTALLAVLASSALIGARRRRAKSR